nr:hypothetical protein [uncultured Oscillibacter sp.]
MKLFIWMLCGVFFSGLLLGSLSACGADRFGVTVITTGGPETAASADTAEREAIPEEEAAPVPETKEEAARLGYGKALWDMYLQGVLPYGGLLDWTSTEEAAKNEFALADVDGDGEEELIVYWTNACTAGMQGLVYGYNDWSRHLELSAFPDLTFYENGTATAGWSHSQGWAGRFWPFDLYQYAPETGEYLEVGAVDAWDLSATEGDEALSAVFPRDADADGDGLVYYILTGEWYQNDRVAPDGQLDGRLWGVDPVDGAEMEAWLSSYTGGTDSLELSFRPMTEENIAALGEPKPDYPARVPVG